MKFLTKTIIVAVGTFIANCALAATHYVSLNSANPVAPFSDWTTAATNIQDAIDTSTNGDLVLVTNGVYSTGGISMDGFQTNRVTLNKALTVQSINGPWVTTIQGTPNGTLVSRCAWLTNNATLIGFTLRQGGTRAGGPGIGGGAWGASSNNSVIANCVIVSNTASQSGGGAYQAMLQNCLISSNFSSAGSGAFRSVLNSCTVVSNAGGAGVSASFLTNCIIAFNTNSSLRTIQNYSTPTTFSYCCITPLPSGVGNFTNYPQLFVDGIHLFTDSPCIGSGTNIVTGTDIFGASWANPPSIGCAELQPAPLLTNPQLTLTSDPVGFSISVVLSAESPFSCWWIKDGVTLQDDGRFNSTQTTNLVAVGVTFADAGNYQLVASNSFGMVTSAVASLVIHCVDAAGANPVAPYLTWDTAATNIQDAITSANVGEVVLITNGLYATGGISIDGQITNRVSITKPVLVQSVNGFTNTIIEGTLDPVTTNGPLAVRCAWLTNSAILSGFTLRGGATVHGIPASGGSAGSGGGVAGSGALAPLTGFLPTNSEVCNCLIEGNYAYASGGGAYLVALNHCTLRGNQVIDSGTFGAGGGADHSILNNCFVISNSVSSSKGGGTDLSILANCAVMGNSANLASAAYGGSLANCTISSNIAVNFGGGTALYGARLTNCIILGNLPGGSPSSNYQNCILNYCCTYPQAAGFGNIAADPLWLIDGLHLSSNSPCVGTGNSSAASGTDIFGRSWNNPPSMGCAEFAQIPPILTQPFLEPFSTGQQITFSVNPIAEPPLSYIWLANGTPIQDNGHYVNSSTPLLSVLDFGLGDSGAYQVIVSNAYGATTSQVFQVNIHAVDVNGTNPVAPFLTWATAATNIQDAIDSAVAGDIVLVTNGVYGAGGKSMDGAQTNRVTIDKALTVLSVNGYSATTIQGAWDPQATTGPLSVRCAWMTNGAVLNGFTLANGSTLPGGLGGGVYCSFTNAIVSNCLLTNNVASRGGGIVFGTINNSLLVFNFASLGQAAYEATLNQCTVQGDIGSPAYIAAPGTLQCLVRNSIVLGYNDNFSSAFSDTYQYSCTEDVEFGTMPSGVSNINARIFNPQFLDLYHLESTTPCRGSGNPLYSFGTDLDGNPWANPPSMGCSEFVPSSRSGPLTVSFSGYYVTYETNAIINNFATYGVAVSDTAASLLWSFSDGTTLTNIGATTAHIWTNAGNESVTVTAFNETYPNGVSATLPVNVFTSPITNSPEFVTAYVSGNITFDTITPLLWLGPPYSFQWYFNGIALTNDDHYAGTESGALTISNVQPSDAGNYYLTANNFNVSGSNIVDVLSVQYLAPSITPGQPASASVYVGGSVSLTGVAIAGSFPLNCQWFFGMTALQDTNEYTGTTSPTLTINPASFADAGGYTLVISNVAGSVTSQVATVTVQAAPPPSFVAYGNAGSNYVQTFDSLPYQPSNSVAPANPVNINGAVYSLGNPYDFAFVPETSGAGGLGLFNAMNGWYGLGNISAGFGASPGDQTNGGVLSFGSTNDAISAANRSLGLLATGSSGGTAFGVRFVNTTGKTLGQFNLAYTGELWRQTATAKTVTNFYYLDTTGTNGFLTNIVSGSLTSLSFPPGDAAWGTNGPLASNAVSLTGQTFTANWPAGAALWVIWEMTDSGEAGQGIGIDNLTFSASLATSLAPVITAEPQAQTVTNGLPASFSVTVSNLLSGGYEWFTNGVALTDTNEFSGSTNATLTINPAGFSDATSYYVVVSNAYGSATSVPVSLTVTAAIIAPGFLSQPQSVTNFVGSNALFSATPSGTQPILYQWQFDGTNVSGATDASLALTNLAYANAGTYTLVLSNSAGTNISFPATLAVVTSPPVQVNFMPQAVAGAVVLQWPSSGGTNLLVTPDLTQPWVPAGLPVISSNFMNSVAVPIGTASQFFRLLQ
ncbi:MAG TPA: immunoglobulin domain-containing protein [Verrucomicrobiae bacterium]|jgi:hypothetical protein